MERRVAKGQVSLSGGPPGGPSREPKSRGLTPERPFLGSDPRHIRRAGWRADRATGTRASKRHISCARERRDGTTRSASSGHGHADPAKLQRRLLPRRTRAAPAGSCTSRTTPTATRSTASTVAAAERHGWKIHAHCLMRTHHHVLIEAPHEALVRGMHLLGTCQAMRLNMRRDRFGHATAGRFGSSRPPLARRRARTSPPTSPTTRSTAGLVDDRRRLPVDFAPRDARSRARTRLAASRAGCPTCSRPTATTGLPRYAHRVDLAAAAIVAARSAA